MLHLSPGSPRESTLLCHIAMEQHIYAVGSSTQSSQSPAQTDGLEEAQRPQSCAPCLLNCTIARSCIRGSRSAGYSRDELPMPDSVKYAQNTFKTQKIPLEYC